MGILALRILIAVSAAIPASIHAGTILLSPTNQGGINRDSSFVAAFASARAGDTVLVQSGFWNITRPIRPRSGVVFTGSATLEFIGTGLAPLIDLDGVSNVEISHLTLRGGLNGRNGISASNATGLFLHHLDIGKFLAKEGMVVGIHFSSKVTGSVISDNILSDMAVDNEWGGGVRLSAGSGHNLVRGNTILNTGRGGLFADASRGNVFRGNTVSGSGLAQGGTGEGLGLEIWGGCDSSLIEDNVLDHWLSVDGSPYTAVRRNKVGVDDGTFKQCGLELVGSGHCVFSGNTVNGGAHKGISISNKPAKDNVYWARNAIGGSSTWALQMQGEEGGASYHYFYGNRFAGTLADHPLALYKNQGHGLRFNANCFHIAFDSNAIEGNGGAGLDFLGSLEDFSFTRNAFRNNGRMLTNPFSGALFDWRGNTLEGPGIQPGPMGTFRFPEAAFSAPSESGIGDTVRFINASKPSQGSGSGWVLWDFDDGLPSTDPDGRHAFLRAGTYRICLVVWDKNGQSARSERILTVKPGGTALGDRIRRAGIGAAAPVRGGRNLLGRRLASPVRAVSP
ncbi:MAG: hypothetical protein JWP91_3055 [Fibrobacteres bacterium]|nr:hypothetical protein [Fibrobacterota bacterium]